MELLLLVFAVFTLAVLAPPLHRRLGAAAPWVFAVVPLLVTVRLAMHLPAVAAGHVVEEGRVWLQMGGVDIRMGFALDGLGLLFALIISGIGTLIVLYAGGYLAGDPKRGRFFLFLFLFMGSMLGAVLADDLIALFVFWELTSISSYLLIGYKHEAEGSRKAALQALLVTGGGGLALLAGLVLLATVTGTHSIQEILGSGDVVRVHGLYLPILLLVLLGAFTKSAQFPFHFWLPSAMAAPTPVSAYLHSATMVKLGVYLLARLHPTLGGTGTWMVLLTGFGATTMLVGAAMAVRQRDLKMLLAHSTVSALGSMVMLLGIGSRYAVVAAVTVLLGHALYKGTLFLVAGAVDHATGTRDVQRLGGLRKVMPVTAAAAFLAAAAFVGLPPFFNFIAKEAMLEAVLAQGLFAVVVAAAVVVSLVLLVVVAARIVLTPFLGDLQETPQAPREAGAAMLVGPVVLAALGILLGLTPSLAADLIVGPAADQVAGRALDVDLRLWHGVNLPFLLTLGILATGAGMYAARSRVLPVMGRMASWERFGPARAYDGAVAGMQQVARVQSRILQNGFLRIYLSIIFGFAAIVLYAAVLRGGGPGLAAPGWDVRAHELLLALVLVVGSLAVVLVRSRLAAVLMLGVVGYAVAAFFILFSAPDLAMTQFLFETLSVLLFVLVLRAMPRPRPLSSRPGRVRDAVLAGSLGLVMALLVMAATVGRQGAPVSGFYAAQSYVAAHGRNVVNVILVDFRGLDTLGEITVLAVAALGVVALLRLRLRGGGG